MAESGNGSHSMSAIPAVTLDDLWREYGSRFDITVITGGYRALIPDPAEGMPVILYGRTPAELAESIRMAEAAR
jgi:hypothetical protein